MSNLVSYLALENLPCRSKGELVAVLEPPGLLVARELCAALGGAFVGQRLAVADVCSGNHHGDRGLTPLGIGDPDNGDEVDVRVLRDHPLDLGGVDVESAGDDHVGL